MSGLICLQLHLVKPQILQSMTRYQQTEKSWFLMFLPPPPPRFSPLNFHSAYLNWSCFARTQAAESRIIELRELSLHPFYLSYIYCTHTCVSNKASTNFSIYIATEKDNNLVWMRCPLQINRMQQVGDACWHTKMAFLDLSSSIFLQVDHTQMSDSKMNKKRNR